MNWIITLIIYVVAFLIGFAVGTFAENWAQRKRAEIKYQRDINRINNGEIVNNG